jgi:hypothetical protein
MQDRISHREHPVSADLASGRAKERQQFSGSSTLVLVGLQLWMTLGLPRGPGLGDSLIGSGLILV